MRVQSRCLVRRLRSGVAPPSRLEELSVGYEAIQGRLNDKLVSLGKEALAAPWFVRGEWGAGKSHFLTYIRGVCREKRVPTSLLTVNARTRTLGHPQSFYHVLAEQLEFGHGYRGIRHAVLERLRTDQGRKVIEAYTKWVPGGELSGALRSLLAVELDDDYLRLVEHPAWATLSGGDLAWADYGYKGEKALRRIAELGGFFRVARAPGLVLLLDEVETIDQLHSIRSHMKVYDVLGRLCRTPWVWCVFAITERFDQTIQKNLRAGLLHKRGLTEHAHWFAEQWSRDSFELVDVPTLGPSEALRLVSTLSSIYRAAHPGTTEDGLSWQAFVADWMRSASRNPRMLIRGAIHEMDRVRPLREG